MEIISNSQRTEEKIIDQDLPKDLLVPKLNRVRSKRQESIQQVIRLKKMERAQNYGDGNNPNNQSYTKFFVRPFEKSHCSICQQDVEINKNIFIADCEHRNMFCQYCLHQYTIYCVQQYNKVVCPNSGCNRQMDIEGKFFKSLPEKIQLRYGKIYRFYLTLQDPTIRMCLRQNCQGLIKINFEESILRCIICESQFCSKCELPLHQGSCEQFEQQFFYKTLNYRKCKKCQAIIQKFEGCNHMTCICGYQFCYVCSADWIPLHYQDHNQEGLVIQPPPPPRNEMIEPPINLFQNEHREPALPAQQPSLSLFEKATLIPRVLLALILYCLLIAFFGLVITATIFASFAYRTKNKHRPVLTDADRKSNRQVGQCVQQMCSNYFQLYIQVWQKIIKC